MEKRYQIFVSSTFADLQEERQAVMQALLSLDHFPAGMELFPASDEDQWSLIKGVIDDSDYYLLVIGGRYGSLDPTGVSYTENEFGYASEMGIPVLAFIHHAPDEIPSGKTDKSDDLRIRLDKFIDRVKSSGRTVKFWSNPDDLKAKVILSIAAETKRTPREGWVRANSVSSPALVESLRQEIDRLREALEQARTVAPVGTEKYASGDDLFEVVLTYTIQDWSSARVRIAMTWDQIFFEIGPTAMEEASELQMVRRLSEEIWTYRSDELKNIVIRTAKVDNDSFETIKIQLAALGLIQKSQKKHVPSDTNKYWSITSFGEAKLMTLRAIPKVEAKSPS